FRSSFWRYASGAVRAVNPEPRPPLADRPPAARSASVRAPPPARWRRRRSAGGSGARHPSDGVAGTASPGHSAPREPPARHRAIPRACGAQSGGGVPRRGGAFGVARPAGDGRGVPPAGLPPPDGAGRAPALRATPGGGPPSRAARRRGGAHDDRTPPTHSTMACQRGIEAASAAGAAGRTSRGTPGPRAPLLTALRVRVAMGSEPEAAGGSGGENPFPGEEDAVPDVLVALDQKAPREPTRRTVPDRRGHGRRDGAPSG